MDQQNCDEEQSPLHIKRELDINIPYTFSPPKDTPKTAIRETETTPKTQIDVSSPRVPFLTHSQIVQLHDDEMTYSVNPLSDIPEEQTPTILALSQSKLQSNDFNIDNISMVNSQQMKFSKKSSEKNEDPIESRIKELEKENFILKKRCNQEKVKFIEIQLETEYKITTLNEQLTDQQDHYSKQIHLLKNELNTAKLQITVLKQQLETPKKPIHLSQSFTEQNTKSLRDNQYADVIITKITQILKLIDNTIEINKKDVLELLQLLQSKIKQILTYDEEEKMDEHRSLIQNLKSELNEVKQLRGQLSKIYYDFEQYKKNGDIDQKINELNLQILAIKSEKLELVDLTQKQINQLNQKDQIINELQQKLNNLSQTDTLRKQSQFVRNLQTNSMVDLKIIKDSLKQKQDNFKKNFKSQNSPQSRSHNPSPTLKFLNSPKNSSAAQQKQENKQLQYRTSDFSVENSSSHHNNSQDMIQKLVEQFKGNTSLAQRIQNYSKKN